ncbi:hypothetical protein B0H13DRAFT_1949860 [Mycena leptocephala]|nr:hypothetical protein B0H13DRAFT_1949860 [Mycena leptocephala]
MRSSLPTFLRTTRSAWAKFAPDAPLPDGPNTWKGQKGLRITTAPSPLHPQLPPIQDPVALYILNIVQHQNSVIQQQMAKTGAMEKTWATLEEKMEKLTETVEFLGRQSESQGRQLSDLRTGMLSIAVPLTLKAGLNTFSLAFLIGLMRPHRRAYKRVINYLNHSLLLPTDNLDVLALASFLLSPLNMQSIGLPNYQQAVFAKLMTEIDAVLPAADAQRLANVFLTVIPSLPSTENIYIQTRVGASLAAFLATARAQLDAEAAGTCPPHPGWVEALWLWKMVEGGNGNLNEASLTPFQLNIILYNMPGEGDDEAD